MKSTKLFLTLLTLMAFCASTWAQTSDSTPPPPPKKRHKAVVVAPPAPPAVSAADVQSLKDALAAQQQQIQALSLQLQQTQQNWQQAQAAAADAASKAAAAQAQANQQQQTVGTLQGDVADLKTTTNNTAMALQDTLKEVKNVGPEWETPMSIHLKGITITPGGFVAAEFVRRSRELGADVTTPFNSLTMPGASQSTLPEFFGSARQTRPTIFVGGKLANVDLSAYVSADFLSAGVTSSATQTNSYTLRLRQAWGQAKFNNGWKLLGGQMWSLVTEGKQGIAPSDDIGRVNDARPSTIDPGYNVGFTFARQYGLRVTKDFGDKVSIAVAMENAQGTLTTHGNAANFLLGEVGASNTYNTASNYTANPSPDIIAKIAFDPGFGTALALTLAGGFILAAGTVLTQGDATFRGGEIIVLLSSGLWTVYSLKAQAWFDRESQLHRAYVASLSALGWLVLIAVALVALDRARQPFGVSDGWVWTQLLATAILSSGLGGYYWNVGASRLGVPIASLWVNLTPFFAVLWAMAYGFMPNVYQLVGGLVALSGVVYMQLRKLRPITA